MSLSGILRSLSGGVKASQSSQSSQSSREPACAPTFVSHISGSDLTNNSKELTHLISVLQSLTPMDKHAMSGRCAPQTDRMEEFMSENLGMVNNDEWIVQGVMSFDLHKPLSSLNNPKVLRFGDGGNVFDFTVEEAKSWQESFRVYAAADIYSPPEEGKALLRKSLEGKSEAGLEAWKMKFVARISRNPIFCDFDGIPHSRKVRADKDKDDWANRIWMTSVSGVDFAGRVHDTMDITHYMTNWQKVYHLNKAGQLYVYGRRDFVPTGARPILDSELLFADLVKMARVRLYAAHAEGIQVVVETGIGLGVFSGDNLGIGDEVRQLSAAALRKVLEEDEARLSNVQLVVCALPIFKRGRDNYHFFVDGFRDYQGRIPVLIADQDMHKLARNAAMEGFRVSELNPADSHGVVGEYWQNRGPGTEEKLALTTAALLTQHHLVNPHVLDTNNYILIDVNSAAPKSSFTSTTASASTFSASSE